MKVNNGVLEIPLKDVLPKNMKWIAADKNGEVYAYKRRPVLDRFNDAWHPDYGFQEYLFTLAEPPAYWRDSLIDVRNEL